MISPGTWYSTGMDRVQHTVTSNGISKLAREGGKHFMEPHDYREEAVKEAFPDKEVSINFSFDK